MKRKNSKGSRTDPAVSEESQEELLLAGFWWRFLAAQLDFILFFAVLSTILYCVDVFILSKMGFKQGAVANGYTFILGSLIYFPLMESSRVRATFGKRILGLSVVDLSGNRISPIRATIRHLLRILSALVLMLGFAIAAVSKRKQGAHDWATRTLVIRNAGALSSRGLSARMPDWLKAAVANNSAKIVAVFSILVLIGITRLVGLMMNPVFEVLAERQMLHATLESVERLKPGIESILNDEKALSIYVAENESKWISSAAKISFDVDNKQFSIRLLGPGLLSTKKTFIKATKVNGSVKWNCSAPDIDQALLPANCVGKVK